MTPIPDNQPRSSTGRFVCTPEMPMRHDYNRSLWEHPDAQGDDRNDPYYDHYRCPNCGKHFAVEVAE